MPSSTTTASTSSSSRSAAVVAQNAALVEVMSVYLNDLILAQNEAQSSTGVDPITMPPNAKFPSFEFFCAEREPGISVRKYAERLVNYMRCTPECFIFALAYARRAVDRGCPLHMRSVHRIMLTSCVVAAKTRDDHYYSMVYYAQVGGVTPADLNSMELRFLLDVIDFRADVSPKEYRFVCADVQHAMLAAKSRSSMLLSPTHVPKTMSVGSHMSDNETPGLSGNCSSTATPTGLTHLPAAAQFHTNPNKHNNADSLRLSMSSRAVQMHPPPTWIAECNIYW